MNALLTYFGEIDDTLRGRYTSDPLLRQGVIDYPVRKLLVACLGLGMLYGLCMGSYSVFRGASEPWLRVLASTIKVPSLLLLTLVVTFPSLYVFSALAGSRLSAGGTLRLLVIAITVHFAVLAGFGPVVAFFTSCTKSYAFIKLLNVAMFAVSGFISLAFLSRALRSVFASGAHEDVAIGPMPPSSEVRGSDRRARAIFTIWIVVYGVVGAQMGWILRPFIGRPGWEFTWFRRRQSSFFEDVLLSIGALLG